MTAKRQDKHSTQFGLWLREQPEIDSKFGYLATNIDYMWRNYKTRDWMLIEEKRYNSSMKKWQIRMFDILNWCANKHPYFRGLHILVFEKTSPEDGAIHLDGKQITKDELISFLQFDF